MVVSIQIYKIEYSYDNYNDYLNILKMNVLFKNIDLQKDVSLFIFIKEQRKKNKAKIIL
jgi:hypothetical protein